VSVIGRAIKAIIVIIRPFLILSRQRPFRTMSFRSAWRHAAKTSPSPPHLSTTFDAMSNKPEPTLVVTNSRPSSTHDPKVDKPAETTETTTETSVPDSVGNGVVEASTDVVATATAKASEPTNGKEPEHTNKDMSSQDAGWFAWWGSTKTESSAALKAEEVKAPSESERPKAVTEATASTAANEEQQPPVSPPSETISMKPQQTASDTSNGSYLAWIWSTPPKSSSTNSEKHAPSEPAIENGTVVNSTNNQVPQESPLTKQPESSTTKSMASSTPKLAESVTSKPPESTSTVTNPLITTLPQTRSSWMSFWARNESIPGLQQTSGPETMHIPDDIDPQGRPLKKQKANDGTSLDITTTEVNASVKSNKSTQATSPSTVVLPSTPTKTPATTKDTPTKTHKKDKSKVIVPPPPNHVLPEFETVYPVITKPEGLLSRMTKAILPRASQNIALHPHPRRCASPPIRKAVAIGIHGFFPLRILRSIMGEPTGTSVKFATLASEAIHRFSERQYGRPDAIDVVKIALEGEGTVAARIDMLWKNLLGKEEWMQHIREADLILVACHSQGSPVGAGIMARLVEEGIVEERTSLGLLCVAGIHLGPATDVGQRVVIKAYNAIESEAARELYGTPLTSPFLYRR
jgi:hypothetical protein